MAPLFRAQHDLAPVVAEQRAAAEVLRLRGEGRSIRAIVATMSVGGWQTRDGGKFHIATVQRILQRAGK